MEKAKKIDVGIKKAPCLKRRVLDSSLEYLRQLGAN